MAKRERRVTMITVDERVQGLLCEAIVKNLRDRVDRLRRELNSLDHGEPELLLKTSRVVAYEELAHDVSANGLRFLVDGLKHQLAAEN